MNFCVSGILIVLVYISSVGVGFMVIFRRYLFSKFSVILLWKILIFILVFWGMVVSRGWVMVRYL